MRKFWRLYLSFLQANEICFFWCSGVIAVTVRLRGRRATYSGLWRMLSDAGSYCMPCKCKAIRPGDETL